MDPIAEFQKLVGARWSYPLVATILTLAIQLARKSPYTGPALKKIPDGLRFITPLLAGGVMGFVHGFGEGRPLSGALVEMVFGMFGVSFTSMGIAATLKESALPWDGGKGGEPLPAKPKDAA